MRIQRASSLVLARTLSACFEGSPFAPARREEVYERTLSSFGQIGARPIVPARSGIR